MAEDQSILERVARAMQERAKQPLGNIRTLEPVLVGSLGDAWKVLAAAAVEAMSEPTEAMVVAGAKELDGWDRRFDSSDTFADRAWGEMIDAALAEAGRQK